MTMMSRRFVWHGLPLYAAGFLACGRMPPSKAAPSCTALVPEAARDVERQGLPSEEARWQAIGRIWAEQSAALRADVAASLAARVLLPSDSLALIADVTRMAVVRRRSALAADALSIWSTTLASFGARRSVQIFYPTPTLRQGEVELDRAYPMWATSDGAESLLHSAVFLADALEIAGSIASVPPADRSTIESEFARGTFALARSHYLRWSFGPKMWQVRGWGCDASGLDILEFARQRRERSLGNGQHAYCQAPTDLDVLIGIGIAHLLAANARDPRIAPIEADERRSLESVGHALYDLFASRLAWHGDRVDFDPGAWIEHPEWRYAGDDREHLPSGPPRHDPSGAWDISHGARLLRLFEVLGQHPDFSTSGTEWRRALEGLSHQFRVRVLAGSPDLPMFRNYLDGTNGWYRVDYESRNGTGYPPHGLSRAFLATRWAGLAARDRDLERAVAGIWRMLTAASQAHCDHFERYFVKGSYWSAGGFAGRPLEGFAALTILPFLATSPTR